MATAGSITWDLVANSSKFVSELEKANKAGKNWGDKLGKAAKGVATTFAAAGTAAAAGLAALYTVTASNIDEQAKFADKIGISTDALAGLQHAGELTGASANTLNLGLQRMTRRVAEAAQGTGTAVEALDALNLSAQDLNQLSPDEQFLAIADAMGEVEGRSEQVRLAFKLFDSGGVALLNTMDMASDGIREAMEQAEHLGIALNRIDAAQVENANDAFGTMTKVSAGIARQLTVAFAPAVEAVSGKFTELALEMDWVGEIGSTVFNAVVTATGYVANAIYGVSVVVAGLRAGFMELAAVAAESMSSSAEVVAVVLNATVGNVGRLLNWLLDQLATVVNVGAMLPGQAGQWARDISGTLEELGASINESLQFDADKVVSGIDDIRAAANNARADFEQLANQELPSETITRMVGEWQKVSREAATASANAKTYNEVVEGSQTAVESLAGLVSTKTSEMERAFQRWGNSFTDAMTDMVTKGEADFTRLAESIINDLIRIAIQANITDQIIRSFGLDSFGSSSGGGTRSTGGPVERGRTYLVGESGPEMFTASNSGTIIPNDQLSRQMQQAVDTFSQAINTMVHAVEDSASQLPDRTNNRADRDSNENKILDRAIRQLTRSAQDSPLSPAVPATPRETSVNVYTQPGETAEVQTTHGSHGEGDMIEIFMKQVDSRINEQISRGQGLARTLEGRYGLTRRAS